MIDTITDQQKNQALSLALMMGGAAMMDPRGTNGQFGASLHNGMMAGMNTALPMMQFMQQSNLAKEDRDYKKSRDRIADRFAKNQETMQAAQMEATERYRSEALKYEQGRMQLAQAQFGFMKDKYEQDLALKEGLLKGIGDLSTDTMLGKRNQPMRINPQTGQPYGNARTPMSEEEFVTKAAQLEALGAPAGSLNLLYNSQFSPSANTTYAREAAGDPYAASINKLRRRDDPFAEMIRSINQFGGYNKGSSFQGQFK